MPMLPAPLRASALLGAAALLLALGACGQKGALYHPDPAAAAATKADDAAAQDAARKKDEKKPAGAPR
jgi:predicted small lipoprotein YifL